MHTSDLLPIDLLVFDRDGTTLGGYEPYARFPGRFSRKHSGSTHAAPA